MADQLKHDIGLSGSFRGAYFSADRSFSGERNFALASVWAMADPPEVGGIRSHFDARAQAQNLTRTSDLSWDLREGHLSRSLGDLDLRAGRQITVWGRADKINPTDSWSTRDFTLLAPDDEDQRLGVAAVQAQWARDVYHVIGLWQPEWRYPILPIPPLPPGVSLRNVAPGNPHGQFGVKLDHSGEGVDWSVSYAHALNRTPDLSILSQGPQSALIGLNYRTVDVAGADAAIPVGHYGLRGEVAYTRTGNQGGADPLSQHSNVLAVVGGERTFGGELNVNMQYLYRRTFDFLDADSLHTVRLLAKQEQVLSNQLATDMQGASLRVNYKMWNETLESELAAVSWFNKADVAIRPKIAYAFSDRFKGAIGAEIFRGPADSFFGRLRAATTAYAEFRVNF